MGAYNGIRGIQNGIVTRACPAIALGAGRERHVGLCLAPADAAWWFNGGGVRRRVRPRTSRCAKWYAGSVY